LIVANLPYLCSDYLLSLPASITRHLKFEPRMALDGGKDGLKIIRDLIGLLDTRMSSRGTAILEIGDNQRRDVAGLCRKAGLKIRTIKDLNGFDRFVVIKKRTH
jgi:release factor glutamine methyltransferase